MAGSKSNLKRVKFSCDPQVVNRLDAYTGRHVTRTSLIERAIVEYLDRLEADEGPHGWITRQ